MTNRPEVPNELIERFRSFSEWRTWVDKHSYIFSTEYIDTIIENIKLSGIIDPLTKKVVTPEYILIKHNNYRETIKADKLISRHRALLSEIKYIAEHGRNLLLSRQSKIYAPEALTDFALFLRGQFPHFLGSEFAETEQEKHAIYPIQAENLMSLSLKEASFNLVISNDVFEHVPDLDLCLREIARVLDDSGVLVSTFPFVFNRETGTIKAKLKDGQISHLTEAEYHGNPMKPDEGSLVFEIPGWDLVNRAINTGFEDAYLVIISSPQNGIVGKDISGIFVFVAIKKILEDSQIHQPVIANSYSRQNKFDAVAGLIGLPRSGTTVLTAAVGEHSKVKAVFEPWNSRKKNMPPTNIGIPQFVDVIGLDYKEEQLLFVKETATDLTYLEAIDFLLTDSENTGYKTRLIWLFRDPMHTFLSEVQARKEWWGETDLEATSDTFDKWAERSLNALRNIIEICQKYPTLCVEYEFFVSAPSETLQKVMAFLDLSFEETQLAYFKSMNKHEVKGDNNVRENPKAISNDSSIKRAAELETIRKVISKSKYFKQIEALCKAGGTLSTATSLSKLASQNFIGEVSDLLSK